MNKVRNYLEHSGLENALPEMNETLRYSYHSVSEKN